VTRILHIISGLGVGGAETVLTQLATALAARGMTQHVVSLSGTAPLAPRLEAGGVPLTQLDLTRPAGLALALPRLIGLTRRFCPDVIQGWMYHGDIGATLVHWVTPGRRSRRLMWGVRCSDMDLGRHAWLIRTEALLSRLPDIIVANSVAGADVHLAHKYRPRRLEIIANGIDTERFRPDAVQRDTQRKALGIAPDQRVAINVARVDPMKDHAGLLAAVRQLPDLPLLLVGAGTEALELPANIRALGVRDDIPALLNAADIIVSCSAFGEGFSNALAEGMSAGLVPVATDVGDARLITSETGNVVQPGDPNALRDALGALLTLPNDDFAERRTTARAHIVDEFGIDRMVDRFAALYRRAAEAASAAPDPSPQRI
jgi:glycosyltransferase involved in cell wall biosynthesis